MPLHICFIHGKESGPWGNKGQLFSRIANERGHEFSALNYLSAENPDDPESRVKMLNAYLAETKIPGNELILVGSSMGGYVAARASQKYRAAGMFLMAPAIGLQHYPVQWPEIKAGSVYLVHGLFDRTIPWMNTNMLSQKLDCKIHLLADDHRLSDSLDLIEEDFLIFLAELESTLNA
ncbi:alpha/beta hydrolase [Oceanospirillum linum]|uniref:Serine aminopeptidase S33 domain-containing protein n=1 Tax=Oceanospirillum linum TaxID=966 RepID=A0A1T1HCX6_OCELI|nr:alpha/beta hydrolase [Oceanospirillum linum]OOV87663.1 hypothetical protein BTA35_0206480 [Oceanospirillum linum]SEF95645.1 Alpha/beta hydrolase family protein [Oleiphilus messinensis]SMP11698.1 Uncharacterised protein family (UPF0227) [Oceanospirillum linum]